MATVTWGSDLIAGPVNRVIATVQNGAEVVRFGGLKTGYRPSPFQIVERCDMYRLRRYFPDTANDPSRPPVILVPPMMMSANVFDVTRDQGAVGVLHDLGVDPWVVDFGSPDRETGGLERTLSDHVVALSRVIDSVHAHTRRKVHLAGYSQGGMFCYQPPGRLFCRVAHPSARGNAPRVGRPGSSRRIKSMGLSSLRTCFRRVIRSNRVKPFAVFPCATDALHGVRSLYSHRRGRTSTMGGEGLSHER